MKTQIKLSMALGILWLLTTSHSKTNPNREITDPNLCLEIDGKILFDKKEPENKCKIYLLCENQIIDSLFLNENRRKFKLTLKKDLFYSLQISKRGYRTKIIWVDTKIPSDEYDGTDLYAFKFSTKLMKDEGYPELNKELQNLPIAIISYNHKLEKFGYDKEYTSNIKKQILIKNHF